MPSTRRRAIATLIAATACFAWTPAAAAQNGTLARAKAKVEDLDYAEANRLLKQAQEDTGTSRSDLLQILELEGVTSAALGATEDGEHAFRELLLLDPTFKLAKRWGPKIQTAFFSAKAWLDDQQLMSLVPAAPQVIDGRLVGVQVQLGYDPLGVVKAIRFHLVNPGQPASVETRQVHAPAKITIAVKPTNAARFWVETLGAHGEVLQELGNQNAPLVEQVEVETAPVLTQAAPPAEAAQPNRSSDPFIPAAVDTTATASASPTLRPLAYTLGALGLVSVITGVVFAVIMGNDNTQLANPIRNRQTQVITSPTQSEAQALSQQSATFGDIAAATIGGGSAMVVGAIGVFIYGTVNAVDAHPAGSVGVSGVW